MSITEAIPVKIEPGTEKVWELLASIPDPEIPVLSILDLGIVREVFISESGKIIIKITPTYSGCPAMDAISMSVKLGMAAAGFKNYILEQVLSPAWTTDWLTESGKEKLKLYGIAAPVKNNEMPHCPQCGSAKTKLLSQFGSTACKALYQCIECKEPFDYFKCH